MYDTKENDGPAGYRRDSRISWADLHGLVKETSMHDISKYPLFSALLVNVVVACSQVAILAHVTQHLVLNG